MAQFGGAGKNPPWARSDFQTATGLGQQMMNQGVATQQAVYNLAAQQNLQSQYQAQQMAAATMQSMQQQAMLPQPGIAMPTSLASPNIGTISYPALKAQQSQQQPKQRVFTGTVTKLHDNFGFVDEDVFFQTTCVKGAMPKVGDRVLVEAQYNANMPFKWNATCVKVLNYQSSSNSNSMSNSNYGVSGVKTGFGNQSNMKPQPLLDQTSKRHDRNRSGNRDFGRDRSRRRDERDIKRDRDRDRSKSKEKDTTDRKRSRSPKRSLSPASSKRSHSPARRRPRIVPRYVVQVPKLSLNMKDANVVSLRSRYTNMYIPSDFFNADFLWHEAFPVLRPFQLGKPCCFHVMHKDVERVGQTSAVLDPPDADHLFSAKVMLIACPSLDDLYHKSCSLSQDPENVQDNFVHPTRLVNFLVGVKGKNEPVAIGGPWSPSLDGANPAEDPKVLIKTAIRTTKALTGINLSGCTQWYRYAEVHYLRPEETHKGKVVPARVETTVIFLPDVWSCQPTHLEWETIQMSFKKQLQKKLAQLEGKEEIQEEGEEAGEATVEKTEPTHFSELDPKTMKIIDLRRELECRNLSSKGLKSQLIARLTKVLKTEEEKEEEDSADKPEEVEEQKEEEKEKVEPEVDEEKKKKEEEEKKKEEERQKGVLERRYTLPDKPSILVFPNPQAKGGKFDCSLMSLSVLLDYRPEDNKEHSFEVSLFAELFNEMLMRDFGFNIYKTMCSAPEKPKEEKKDKEKEKEKDKDKKKEKDKDSEEPATKKKKLDEKEKKDSDKKESKDEDKEKKDSEEKKEEKKDDKKDKDDKEKDEKKDKKEKKEKKKYMTVKPDLLLSCIYFDQNHTGYILDKDCEEIVHSVGLALSRAQVKKLVQKVVYRDTFSYRKITDITIGDEDKSQQPVEMEIDMDEVAAGNTNKLRKPTESLIKSRGSSNKGKNEPLTGMVMYNGAMVDIDSVLERLQKGDKSIEDFEKKMTELTDERDKLKKDLAKKEDAYTKLSSDLKSLKHELSVQERITNSSESSNKKYLSVLMETQGLLNTLVTKVNSALDEDTKLKEEKEIKKENGNA